jgi:hypothetical protein
VRPRHLLSITAALVCLAGSTPTAALDEPFPSGICPVEGSLEAFPAPGCEIPVIVRAEIQVDDTLVASVIRNLENRAGQRIELDDNGLIRIVDSVLTTPIFVDLRGWDISTQGIFDGPSGGDGVTPAIMVSTPLGGAPLLELRKCTLQAYDSEPMDPAPQLHRTAARLPGFPDELLGSWDLDLTQRYHEACPWLSVTGTATITNGAGERWSGTVESGTYDPSTGQLDFLTLYRGTGNRKGADFRELIIASGEGELEAAVEWLTP